MEERRKKRELKEPQEAQCRGVVRARSKKRENRNKVAFELFVQKDKSYSE
jgi:hypothetical protein